MNTEEFKEQLEEIVLSLNKGTSATLTDISIEYGETLSGKACMYIDLKLEA